jgi:Ca2+-transporting ATPase
MDQLGKRLGVMVLGITVAIFIFGILIQNEPVEMFMLAIALAVAAIPEGLPAVVTITLAIGIRRIARRKGIVKRLKTVETLGSATVICTDKTGTLTKNEMTVTKVYCGYEMDIEGVGYDTKENLVLGRKAKEDKRLELLLASAELCNNSEIILDERGRKKVRGDPTEGSLIILAEKAGLHPEQLPYKRVSELSFDSERKMMSVVCRNDDKQDFSVFTKGALEAIIQKCRTEFGKALDSNRKKEILELNERYASNGLRVLAVAHKKLKNIVDKEKIEEELDFIGLVGMIDPPREEAKTAIDQCKSAGIKVIMVTGDHLLTARAIGEKLGLLDKNSVVLSGKELDTISDQDLQKEVENIAIFARVSAKHKMRIIKALKANGHVVAMTGDGINDAPSLKAADIGVAMGITGTDVAKEASDMVLTDDNFATIVNAVEEGRGIYENIKKTTHYLLSCNISEVLVISSGLFAFGYGILNALQILWMNLVTDSLSAIALGMDPLAPGLMARKPRKMEEGILNKQMFLSIIGIGVFLTIAVFAPFYLGHFKETTFSLLILLQLMVVLAIRPEKLGKIKNPWLGITVILSVVLQMFVVFSPASIIFSTRALKPFELEIIALTCLVVILVLEGRKYVRVLARGLTA